MREKPPKWNPTQQADLPTRPVETVFQRKQLPAISRVVLRNFRELCFLLVTKKGVFQLLVENLELEFDRFEN